MVASSVAGAEEEGSSAEGMVAANVLLVLWEGSRRCDFFLCCEASRLRGGRSVGRYVVGWVIGPARLESLWKS